MTDQLPGSFITCDGKDEHISWGRVNRDRPLPSRCYRAFRHEPITQIVLHHDACFSSDHAYGVLERRGLSYHFSIDNDGTIHQWVDPRDTAWHARDANVRSIGICLSNAHEYQYADRYDPPRPLVRGRVHGVRLSKHLGFYGVQVQATKMLIDALTRRYDIPLQTPRGAQGVLPDSLRTTPGIYGHYHMAGGKIDPIGLDISGLVYSIGELFP